MLLLGESLCTTSLNTYRRPWQLLRQLCSERLHIFPISTEHVALFVAFVAEQKYAASPVLIYISAFSLPHLLAYLPDPTKNGYDSTSTAGL